MNKSGEASKTLYSETIDSVQLQQTVRYNTHTNHIGIGSVSFKGSGNKYTGFLTKTIYSEDIEGINLHQRVSYNLKTDHIGIQSVTFIIQQGWSGIVNNKNCATYLGVTVAEQVLAQVYKHVERAPNGNRGYDFKCSRKFLIDVKASIRVKNRNAWFFNIRYNPIPDYFLCLAFDSRENLNPEHIWLIPVNRVKHLKGLLISESRLDKWSKYEKTNKMNRIVTCCNVMKDKVDQS